MPAGQLSTVALASEIDSFRVTVLSGTVFPSGFPVSGLLSGLAVTASVCANSVITLPLAFEGALETAPEAPPWYSSLGPPLAIAVSPVSVSRKKTYWCW
jgi:hypothetical protein